MEHQPVAAGHVVFLYLFRQAVFIPLTHFLGSLFDIPFGLSQRSQSLGTHQIGGFDRLTGLVIHACPDQFHRMPAIIASHEDPRLRKLMMRQFHHVQRRLRIVGADHRRMAEPAPEWRRVSKRVPSP